MYLDVCGRFTACMIGLFFSAVWWAQRPPISHFRLCFFCCFLRTEGLPYHFEQVENPLGRRPVRAFTYIYPPTPFLSIFAECSTYGGRLWGGRPRRARVTR